MTDEITQIVAGLNDSQKRAILSARVLPGDSRLWMLTYRDRGVLVQSIKDLKLLIPSVVPPGYYLNRLGRQVRETLETPAVIPPVDDPLERLKDASLRATGLLENYQWRPTRAHFEGLRNSLNEAIRTLGERDAKMRMFVSHATGGRTQDITLHVNQLSVLATQKVNDAWYGGIASERERVRKILGQCPNDGGMDRETGPIGCLLVAQGGECICAGIAGQLEEEKG